MLTRGRFAPARPEIVLLITSNTLVFFMGQERTSPARKNYQGAAAHSRVCSGLRLLGIGGLAVGLSLTAAVEFTLAAATGYKKLACSPGGASAWRASCVCCTLAVHSKSNSGC